MNWKAHARQWPPELNQVARDLISKWRLNGQADPDPEANRYAAYCHIVNGWRKLPPLDVVLVNGEPPEWALCIPTQITWRER